MEELLGKVEGNSGKNNQPCLDIGYNQAFYDLFSLLVGSGKRFSIKEIARATDISSDTISNWSQGISAPNFDNLMVLCRVMPFEFKSRFIAMLGGNDLAQQIRKDHAGILRELAERTERGEI